MELSDCCVCVEARVVCVIDSINVIVNTFCIQPSIFKKHPGCAEHSSSHFGYVTGE